METKTTKHHHHHHKHARSRSFSGGAIVSFLKNTAASFSTTTTSTSTTKRPSSFNHRNAFSGPIAVSIVPPAARGGSRRDHRSGYKTPEPSSPKVSCIGQIKKAKSKKLSKACCKNGVCPLPPRPPPPPARQKSSLVRRMLFRRSRSRSASSRDTGSNGGGFFKGRKSTSSTAVAAAPPPAGLGLGQMKRFTSGRAAFEDFDWREAERRGSDYEEEDDEDEVFVAHSAPLVMGGGLVASEPRKEVNLWSRRPMSPPTPLRLP